MHVNYLINLISSTPRRYRVIEGTLKGRQTVATLFWAQQYQIQGWFGYRRHLRRDQFDHLLADWQQSGIVELDPQQQTVRLTAAGCQLQQAYRNQHYLPRCGHWSWLVNTDRLAQRLLLGIQTVSELAHHNRRYVPLNVAPAEMAAVKRWFYAEQERLLNEVPRECQAIASKLAQGDPRWPNLFVYSLVGYQTSGLFTEQFQALMALPAESITLMNHDVWLTVGKLLTENPQWCLARLGLPLVRRSPLTASAEQTLQLYQAGMPLSQIARRRRLKVTTVREHLLSAAIQLPGSVDARSLIGKQRWQQFADEFQGPIAKWKWQPSDQDDPAESFFAFRLYQIVRSQNDE